MRVRGIILIWILLAFSVGITQSTSFFSSANQASESSESISKASINSKRSYIESEELISDPLNYSTFIGGYKDDRVEAMALDSYGNVYVAGHTSSPEFPTVNAFESTYGGGYTDCFVLKLSADGSELLFSTFIGGQDYEYAKSIVVDEFGNAYVTGLTNSTDFPSVNAYNSTHGGNPDCFVLKLSANGSTLLYSTFIGGAGLDSGESIAVDTSGNAYVTGYTESTGFPTVNAYDSTFNGTSDSFVFKLSNDGSTLVFSTFIGGSGHDAGTSVILDTSCSIYVTGYTESADFPTVDAYDSTYHHSMRLDRPGDCFVFKLSADGSTLLYSTFVGGSTMDSGRSIAVDSSCNVYVTGYTSSYDFPTVNAYDSNNEGGDCFVFKLSNDGSTLVFSTFIGGEDPDYAYSIALDASGNVYVTGSTVSPDFPTVNAYNSNHGGKRDCFVFKLSANGLALLYSTFIGGSSLDWGCSIAIDTDANVYVAGTTESENFPTVNCYNATFGGDEDCFILKFHPTDQLPPTILPGLAQLIAALALVGVPLIGVFYMIKKRRLSQISKLC
ncbi:MAG: SBBP repeat-containing protein [Promethearchaeota archaeon]